MLKTLQILLKQYHATKTPIFPNYTELFRDHASKIKKFWIRTNRQSERTIKDITKIDPSKISRKGIIILSLKRKQKKEQRETRKLARPTFFFLGSIVPWPPLLAFSISTSTFPSFPMPSSRSLLHPITFPTVCRSPSFLLDFRLVLSLALVIRSFYF